MEKALVLIAFILGYGLAYLNITVHDEQAAATKPAASHKDIRPLVTWYDSTEFDGCDYVQAVGWLGGESYVGFMAHKGTCRYCRQQAAQ
jgi:hypothetical protein